MSWPKLNLHSTRSWSCAALLAVAALLLLCFDVSAAAPPVAPASGLRPLTGLPAMPAMPVVQVTTDPAGDAGPALVMADGKLLIVFWRDGRLWSRASTDGGATWGAEAQVADCCLSDHSLARSADGTVWLVYDRSREVQVNPPGDWVLKREIWYRTSADGGVTWSAERQLPTDAADNSAVQDYNPILFQAADQKVWVVWESDRDGVHSIWYKTSADGGATWTAGVRLAAEGYAPAAAATSGGRVVVVYQRGSSELWQRLSNDGVTWSAETRIAGCCRQNPSLAAAGGVLWLAYENDGNIWYRTSTNQGRTWLIEASFTRFAGSDAGVALAALGSGSIGIAWQSDRGGNPDIWFGSPGEREDINPPPTIEWIARDPSCNLDSTRTITFRARALDETDVASVELVWTLNGSAQEPLALHNDGMNGDDVAGDGVWGGVHAPLAAGSQVTFRARATDIDGNPYLYPYQDSFTVLPPFAKAADILFVPDAGGNDTSWFRSYYTGALDALGYEYDTWDTSLRCAPEGAVLSRYTAGAILWAAPHGESYLIGSSAARAAVQSYLDAKGKLFITGQRIAYYTRGTSFLRDYLHAAYVRGVPDLRIVKGTAGSPIGDGLTLGIAGGDGADNQEYPGEVAPIAPAETEFTYQGATGPTAPPASIVAPEPTAPPAPTVAPEPTAPPATPAPPVSCTGPCAAGLHVDTGAYRVVYFAFGFEAINRAAHRACVMGRVLDWLSNTPSRPCLSTPPDAQRTPAGDVIFSWTAVPGATGYEIQIDTVPTFDSPDLFEAAVAGTDYRHHFTTLGMRYWRVRRALPEPVGEWTAAWSFSVASTVVQVTTDPADDAAPALAQTADGRLLAVFVRSGELWSRASPDGGATWGAETRIAGCCRYHPSLARAADGRLWLAYDRDRDIWYRTSADGGATWSEESQLTIDSSRDDDPVVFQAADGKLWVAWSSDRADYSSIWYKTSTDGGATWSADTRLSTNYSNYAPAATVAADGRLIVVWQHYDGLSQRSSEDGGANWSDEKQIAGCCGRAQPGLATVGGSLWLVYAWEGDIWYRTSADQGETWSNEVQFTRFVGEDDAPAVAPLTPGSVGIAWQSDRGGNPDVWFGIPGIREDLNPPPYVESIEHRPAPNPDSDDTITFRARALDEKKVASVKLIWTVDGQAQPDLDMFDDGTHSDDAGGDGIWGVRHEPLPEGSRVTYQVQALDADGNNYRYPGRNSFTVLPAFIKTASILFVPDAGSGNIPNDTAWFRSYYTNTLEALGYRYDTWDTALRGEPGSVILGQYIGGTVIWAVPYRGYATQGASDSIDRLRAYLDAGGHLFITGQNIAEDLRWSGGEGFLTDYLHASFVQGDTGLFTVVCDGRVLNISGGDGANNQYSKDEVDPLAAAEVMCTYRSGASDMLAEPIRDASAPPAASAAAAPAGNVRSGTAALRVETDAYKVVYFSFGFEAINNAADRKVIMEQALSWLEPPLHRFYMPQVSVELPAADAFWADRDHVGLGGCTILHWYITNAREVYLDDVGMPGNAVRLVCPTVTTTYVLRVVRDSGTQEYRVTIVVDDSNST